ncbi:hypothetical protein C6P45_003559 [Maudiozyma exigua]|uniref:SGNH hydrolase-type esterase domain-containing protein n=1 Tax=Maudiozyma exigua TaxID=34358 RepID=A0A9P6WCX0_MAUEX|nr:hypothetical protein C6P45_003559 [Kazachstania exigua]
MNYEKYLIFGDSITEFSYNPQIYPEDPIQFTWGGALTSAYTRRMDVIQRGFIGYNTRQAKKILPKILEHDGRNVKMASIGFGTNDASTAGPFVIPVEEYRQNILEMIGMLRNHGIEKILLISPAAMDHAHWKAKVEGDIKIGMERSNEAFVPYVKCLEDIAHQEKIGVVNLNKPFNAEIARRPNDWQKLFVDGVHLGNDGSKIYFNELMNAIKKIYPEYHPDNLPYKLPEYPDLLPDLSNLNP